MSPLITAINGDLERARPDVLISNIHSDLDDPHSPDSDDCSSTTIDESDYLESSQLGNFL
jgi:hypothetical protein